MTNTETKSMIGLWEPKVPSFSASLSLGSKSHLGETSTSVYRPHSQLIDGLFVPPNDPKKLHKLLRTQVKDTAGKFDMPALTITPELKKDLQILKVGTVIEPASEYYTGRLTKKERKATIADELLYDTNLAQYRKRKVQEIEEQNRSGGVDKWKIRGKQSRKRAKQRRH